LSERVSITVAQTSFVAEEPWTVRMSVLHPDTNPSLSHGWRRQPVDHFGATTHMSSRAPDGSASAFLPEVELRLVAIARQVGDRTFERFLGIGDGVVVDARADLPGEVVEYESCLEIPDVLVEFLGEESLDGPEEVPLCFGL
jgi:hypothetical protein